MWNEAFLDQFELLSVCSSMGTRGKYKVLVNIAVGSRFVPAAFQTRHKNAIRLVVCGTFNCTHSLKSVQLKQILCKALTE